MYRFLAFTVSLILFYFNIGGGSQSLAGDISKSNYDSSLFEKGDSMVFDNPISRWEVEKVEEGRIWWRSDNGDSQVTSFNAMLPPLLWSSRLHGSGRREIETLEGAIFPLRTGESSVFKVKTWKKESTKTINVDWICVVKGKVQKKVPGGSFDTVEVVCGTGGDEQWAFFYAPDIKYYVEIQNMMKGESTSVRRLLSYDIQSVEAKRGSVTPTLAPTNAVESSKRYAIQFIEGSNEAFMQALLKNYPGQPLRLLSGERNGQPWFRMVYGDFADAAAAQQALPQLPKQLPQRDVKVVNQ